MDPGWPLGLGFDDALGELLEDPQQALVLACTELIHLHQLVVLIAARNTGTRTQTRLQSGLGNVAALCLEFRQYKQYKSSVRLLLQVTSTRSYDSSD